MKVLGIKKTPVLVICFPKKPQTMGLTKKIRLIKITQRFSFPQAIEIRRIICGRPVDLYKRFSLF